jgi:hypothetical protein
MAVTMSGKSSATAPAARAPSFVPAAIDRVDLDTSDVERSTQPSPEPRRESQDIIVEYHVAPDGGAAIRRTARPGAGAPALTGARLGPHHLADPLGQLGRAEVVRAVAPDGTELWIRVYGPEDSRALDFLGALLVEGSALAERGSVRLPRFAGVGIDRGHAWIAFGHTAGLDPATLAARLPGGLDDALRASLTLGWAQAAVELLEVRRRLGPPFDHAAPCAASGELLVTGGGDVVALEPLFALGAERCLGARPGSGPPLDLLAGAGDAGLITLAHAWTESAATADALRSLAECLGDHLHARGLDARALRAAAFRRALAPADAPAERPSLDAWTRTAEAPLPTRRFAPVTPPPVLSLGSPAGSRTPRPSLAADLGWGMGSGLAPGVGTPRPALGPGSGSPTSRPGVADAARALPPPTRWSVPPGHE